jgi:hypothetical protein
MKNRFICKVCVGDTELHSKEYKTLKEIAEDLGLTYQQIADISVGRMKKFSRGGFKYQPSIEIQKISV